MDIISWLFMDTVLGFIFYSTGCLILKIITLGHFNIALKNYSDFISFKRINIKRTYLIMLLGVFFYITIIALIAYSNTLK
jgi:hypothetical protein